MKENTEKNIHCDGKILFIDAKEVAIIESCYIAGPNACACRASSDAPYRTD